MEKLVFVLVVLCTLTGITVSGTIFTFPGETVILQLRGNITSPLPTVEWSKPGMENYVIVFRDNRESEELKNQIFHGRTSLFVDELRDGNISLKISKVQQDDAGTYRCKLIQEGTEEFLFELVMGVVSEPRLTFVPAVDGQVTLQCEARCWFPLPDIRFYDDRDEEIEAQDPKSEPCSGKCCNATRRVALQQTRTTRVSCRVHQQETNRTWPTETFIPAPSKKSDSGDDCRAAWTLFGFAVIFAAAVPVLICCFCGAHCPCQEGGKAGPAVNSREASSRSTNADGVGNEFVSARMAEIEELKVNIQTLTRDKNNLSKENESLRKDKNTLTKEKNDLTKENESLRKENESLRKENNSIKASQSLDLWESGSSSPPSSPVEIPALHPLSQRSPQRSQQSLHPALSPSSPAASEKALVRTQSLSSHRQSSGKSKRAASVSGRQFTSNNNGGGGNSNLSRPQSGRSSQGGDSKPASPTGRPLLDTLSPGGPQGPAGSARSMDNMAQFLGASGKSPVRIKSFSVSRTPSTSSNRYSLLEGLDED